MVPIEHAPVKEGVGIVESEHGVLVLDIMVGEKVIYFVNLESKTS
jgi:hypothetical protein